MRQRKRRMTKVFFFFFLKGVVCTVCESEMNGKEKKKQVSFSSTLIYT